MAVLILLCAVLPLYGCLGSPSPPYPVLDKTPPETGRVKVFIFILDALQQKTLMDTLDDLPNFKHLIKGKDGSYPYIYFENVLVSIPSSSKPSNVTLLTGVYPRRHGIPSTLWFDRKKETIMSLPFTSQTRMMEILEETGTDTLFDYAGRSEKETMAVATQVAKGVDKADWIKQSLHLWSQAFWVNVFANGIGIPDGAFLDRGITGGLLNGYMVSLSDGLKGWYRSRGDIPDLTVVHYVGLDLFTHYPRKFLVRNNRTIREIQSWYLKNILDPQFGKVYEFLRKTGNFENVVFFFVADHGQTRIARYINEKKFEKEITSELVRIDQGSQGHGDDVVMLPGASTKAVYVRNRQKRGWMNPPRLCEDVKRIVDVIMAQEDMKVNLQTLLVSQYPGERNEGLIESDKFWFFDLVHYRDSDREKDDFIASLKPLDNLDRLIGKQLTPAKLYREDYSRVNRPDIILINKPGSYFVADMDKYAHHGGIYQGDAMVSFVVSGPGIRRFSRRAQKIDRLIETVDLVPMAAYVAGIKIDRQIDGKNQLPEVR